MSNATDESLLSAEFLARLEQLELVSRKILTGRFKGDRLSKRKGTSVEFADYKNYVVGDDLRFLDWNLFARLDRLFIKLFQEEEDLHFSILIDNSISMDFGTPTKLHYAKQVAAALAFVGLVNLDRVALYVFNSDIAAELSPLRGRRSVWRMMNFLQDIKPAGAGNLSKAMKTFVLKSSGRGIVVLLTDFMDKAGFEEPLRYLVARQMDVYAIQILSQEEIEPDLKGDLRLIDIEDNDVAEVTVSAALIRRYKQNLAAFRAALQEYCNRRGICYIFTSTQQPFDQLVLTYLRQRGLVR
ncbi:MAG: DUF58 domain-containing protein [Gemmatales bacterium]|nr:DUF58 domain-containing protein [Gemmatales bacterium]MDW8387152.1 DUF58 domain-containing protein [Gemmatales bacterium]